MSKIVLTGAPGSGKTTLCSLIARSDPNRFAPVPEAATQVYSAAQARWDRADIHRRRDLQRQIYRLQRDQEDRIEQENPAKTLILDRATIDGAAYWPDGPDDYMTQLKTNFPAEFARYDLVILLQTAAAIGIYDGSASNPVRFEDAAGALAAADTLERLWSGHPNLVRVQACVGLHDKFKTVQQIIESHLTP
jgi:predicted ATPase